MKRLSCWGLLLGICLLPIHPAHAVVDDTLEQIEDAVDEPLRIDKSDYTDRKFPPIRLTFKEEVEGGDFDGTDVTTFRTTITGEIRFSITKKYFAAVSTHYGITATEFHGDNEVIKSGKSSEDPWNALHEFSLRYRSQYLLNDHWGAMFASWMVSRYEDGANFDDGLKGAGATAITDRFGSKLSILGGVAISSKIVGNGVSVSPFGQFSWKIDILSRPPGWDFHSNPSGTSRSRLASMPNSRADAGTSTTAMTGWSTEDPSAIARTRSVWASSGNS